MYENTQNMKLLNPLEQYGNEILFRMFFQLGRVSLLLVCGLRRPGVIRGEITGQHFGKITFFACNFKMVESCQLKFSMYMLRYSKYLKITLG